jgi:PAS domain S-box-containing protein
MLCATTRKVLFVDDDKSILAALKRQLKSQFDISTCDDPRKGLEIVRKKGPFPVIVSDLEMGGMSGVEFLAQARQIHPQTICILATGHKDLNIGAEATNKGLVFRFLSKPVTIERLTEAIDEAFAQHERLMLTGRYTYSVMVKDGQPVQTEYHESCALVTGYTAQEFEKSSLLWISIVLSEFRDAVIEFGNSILCEHRSGCIEYQIRKKDGLIRWLRDTVITHFDENENLTRFDGLIEDITEERKVQADIREKMRLSRVLVDALPCRAMLVDESTHEIVVANQMAVQAGAVPGRKCYTAWDARGKECPWCRSQHVGEGIEPVQAELELEGKWWQVHWIPVTGELFLHCAFDVTSHRQMERSLIAANEKLKAQELANQTFAAELTGEMRTPLFAVKDVLSNAVAGKLGDASPRLMDALKVAQTKVERMSKVVGEHLDRGPAAQ